MTPQAQMSSSSEQRKRQQRTQALAAANRIRLRQSEIKRSIRRGDPITVDVLNEPDVQSMYLIDLLRAQTRWGYARAGKILDRLRISRGIRIRNLTDRRKRALVIALRMKENGVQNQNLPEGLRGLI